MPSPSEGERKMPSPLEGERKMPSPSEEESLKVPSDPPKPKRQRVDLTWDEKRKICEVQLEKPTFTHSELAKYMVDHHGFRLVNRSTISKILDESQKWLEVSPNLREGKTRRVRDAKWPQVDKALMLWVGQIRARKGAINDNMLIEKATEFRDAFGISKNDFKLSHGWLEKFKSRHEVACQSLHTNETSNEVADGVPHAKLLGIIASYNPENVFNYDEIGLYYRASPSKPLIEHDRVTLGLCANISGKERMKMIFVHKSPRPRCFPEHFDPNNLVHFFSNVNAWMSSDIFTAWVMGENKRMADQDRNILVLLDDAASHSIDGILKTKLGDFDAIILSNITLLFLPTPSVQPLDQGVISALKLRYKRKLLTWMLTHSEGQTLDVLQCMIWLFATWNDLDAEIVRNAWRVADIFPRDWIADIISLEERVKVRMDEEVGELEKLIAALNPPDPMTTMEYVRGMVDEDNVEAEYSTLQITALVENNGESMGHGLGLIDQDDQGDDAERVQVDLAEARVCAKKVLDFMLGQGSSSFDIHELLLMEKVCDKLSRLGVADVTATHIKSFAPAAFQ